MKAYSNLTHRIHAVTLAAGITMSLVLVSTTHSLFASEAGASSATESSPVQTNDNPSDTPENQSHSELYQPLFNSEEDQWQFGVLVYGFLPVSTDLTTKLPGVPPVPEMDLHLDLGEAVELLNMTFSGRLEAHKGDLGLFLEGYYVTFALDNSVAKFELDQYFVDFGVSYQLPPLRFSDHGRVALFTELTGGGRYVHFKETVSFKGTPPPLFAGSTRGASANYLEPFVGARLALPFAKKWTAVVRGDVGGFGIGSDLTWTAVGGLAFHPAPKWEIAAGYRVYSLNYEEGSGISRFKMSVFQHGPYLGVGFRF